MKFRTTTFIICLTTSGLMSSPTNAVDLFSDSFESGDMLNMNNYFKWYGTLTTSVVSSTHEVNTNFKPTNTPKDSAADFPGGDWTAKTGEHSLRFRYPAGEPMSEQRFGIRQPLKDVWIRFWLRVPLNYSYGPIGSPNKLFAIWSDGYSSYGQGSTVWLGMHRWNSTGSTVSITYSDGDYKVSNGYQQSRGFITTADRGRWMHLVIHVKAESSPGASDGIIQTYRRWQDESTYSKLHQLLNAPLKLPDAGPNGFAGGYILGWHNAPFSEGTEYLVDDFVLSDSSPMADLTGKLPMPPSNIAVKSY